jgi:hypothetical protein
MRPPDRIDFPESPQHSLRSVLLTIEVPKTTTTKTGITVIVILIHNEMGRHKRRIRIMATTMVIKTMATTIMVITMGTIIMDITMGIITDITTTDITMVTTTDPTTDTFTDSKRNKIF